MYCQQILMFSRHLIQSTKSLRCLPKCLSTSISFPDSKHIEARHELHGFAKLCNQHGNYTTLGVIAHLTGDQTILMTNVEAAIRQILVKQAYMRSRIVITRESACEGDTKDEQHILETYSMTAFEELSSLSRFYLLRHAEDLNDWRWRLDDGSARNPHLYDVLDPSKSIIFPLIHYELIINRYHQQNGKPVMFHLIVYMNHAISDGRSSHPLLHDFLTALTHPNRPLVQNIQSVIPPVSFPKPYGRLLFYYYFYKHLITIFWYFHKRAQTPSRIPFKQSTIIFNSKHPTRQGRSLFYSSTSDKMLSMKAICEQHHISLHGPLCAFMLLTIHHLFPINGTANNDDMIQVAHMDIPHDMRSILVDHNVTHDSVGCFVGTTIFKPDLISPLMPFWKLAHYCAHETEKQKLSKAVHIHTGVFDKLLANQYLFRKSFIDNNGVIVEISFSNIGRYMYNPSYNSNQIMLHGLHGSNMAPVYRESLHLSIQSVKQFDISLNHTFEYDLDAVKFMRVYCSLIENIDRFASLTITVHDVLQFLDDNRSSTKQQMD
ncbi:unnamed protein product [Rotaria magnacalcarata]|uniref:Condensation domain-containing protein n=2 Tax=Rotaria magnacalcarata TaxID=392030 RepID=A0A816Z1M6_9BILA|nr:unnamed protein product [Rotaria magnacalcarata]